MGNIFSDVSYNENFQAATTELSVSYVPKVFVFICFLNIFSLLTC